ncbi:hypothetical protein NE865_06143 [Phthorimaea operculella]|nr:hypothetical protein NE865_06143 [Phthorimaea operculella]
METLKMSIDALASTVHARMAAFEEELKKDPSAKKDTVNSIATEFQCFRTFVVASLGALQKQIGMLTDELDTMEMRSRRKMLLLHGVPEQKDEDTTKVVVTVVKEHLSLPELQPEDIRRAHRMGRFSSASSKPRPLLVKFTDAKTRDEAWMSKVGLKGTGITVSEFLTQRRHRLFKAARLKLGVSKCWTREGRIIYLAPDGKRHTISSSQYLESVCPVTDAVVAPSQGGVDPSTSGTQRTAPPKRAKTTPVAAKK